MASNAIIHRDQASLDEYFRRQLEQTSPSASPMKPGAGVFVFPDGTRAAYDSKGGMVPVDAQNVPMARPVAEQRPTSKITRGQITEFVNRPENKPGPIMSGVLGYADASSRFLNNASFGLFPTLADNMERNLNIPRDQAQMLLEAGRDANAGAGQTGEVLGTALPTIASFKPLAGGAQALWAGRGAIGNAIAKNAGTLAKAALGGGGAALATWMGLPADTSAPAPLVPADTPVYGVDADGNTVVAGGAPAPGGAPASGAGMPSSQRQSTRLYPAEYAQYYADKFGVPQNDIAALAADNASGTLIPRQLEMLSGIAPKGVDMDERFKQFYGKTLNAEAATIEQMEAAAQQPGAPAMTATDMEMLAARKRRLFLWTRQAAGGDLSALEQAELTELDELIP